MKDFIDAILEFFNAEINIKVWLVVLMFCAVFVFYLYGTITEQRLKDVLEQNLCTKKLSEVEYRTCEIDCSNELAFCRQLYKRGVLWSNNTAEK